MRGPCPSTLVAALAACPAVVIAVSLVGFCLVIVRRGSAVGVAAITDAVDGDGVVRLFEDDAVVADTEAQQAFERAAERFDLPAPVAA